MNRRKLIATLGATAAATSGAVGTGAFTSVSADRSVSVAVAGDQNAFLRIGPCTDDSGNPTPNSAYAQFEGGTFTLDLTGANGNDPPAGSGVNADAVSRFDDVFEIRNQGTQPIGAWLEAADAATNPDGDPKIEFYRDGDPGSDIVAEGNSLNAKCLDVGERICIGFRIRTESDDEDETDLFDTGTLPGSNGEELVINGDVDVACGAPSGSGGATDPDPTRLDTGEQDWTVVALPPEARAEAPADPPYEAFTVDPPSVWATSEEAEWIDPFDDGGREDDPANGSVPFVYELNFETTAERTLTIEEYGSDNPVEFFLDGSNIGGSEGENAFRSLRSNLPAQSINAGEHTLRAEVINNPGASGGNPTGLLVAARLE